MFQKMIFLIISISLISNICFADDVTYLNQNDKAPYPGYLFTEPKTKDVRIKLLERDTFETINNSLTKTNTFLTQNSDFKDQQLKITMDRNDELAKALRDEKSANNWERIGWFAGGLLTAILTVYGIKKASQ